MKNHSLPTATAAFKVYILSSVSATAVSCGTIHIQECILMTLKTLIQSLEIPHASGAGDCP